MNQTTRSYHPIDLDSVFEALRQPLALLEERNRETVEAFIATARVHQERAIIDVLSDMTAAVNADASETTIHLEYESKQLVLTVDHNTTEETDDLARLEGDPEKVTIRLPAQLKQSIDLAADSRGVSVNTWCVFTLARAISRYMRHGLEAPGDPSSERRHGRRGKRRRGLIVDDSSGRGDQQ